MVRLLATGVVCNVGGVRSNMACVSPGNLDLLPLHVHSNRGIVIAGCAVAELLVIVLAPAVGDAIGGHRARKMFPRTERGEVCPPATATGTELEMLVPSPSAPYWLSPQQKAFPFAVSPQVTDSPADRVANESPPRASSRVADPIGVRVAAVRRVKGSSGATPRGEGASPTCWFRSYHHFPWAFRR